MHQRESDRAHSNVAFDRVGRWARRLVVGAGLFALVASLALDSVNLPFTHWRVDRSVIGAAGLAFVVIGWTLRFAPVQAALASSALAWSIVLAFLVGYRPPQRGDIALAGSSLLPTAEKVAADSTPKVWVSEIEWYNQYLRPDPRWGHGGIPSIVAHHHHREFEVDYTLDREGWRVMPRPATAPPRGEIVFLGCSFTFGIGVEDGETFAALLAAGPWSGFRVKNHAHSAWGTTHALLFLEHRLRQEPKPACVFYAWISRHARRNYRRKSWHKGSGLPFPHFELEEGRPRFLGMLQPAEADLADGPELDAAEADLSLALIRALRRLCDDQGIPFFVVALEDGEPTHDLVLPRLKEENGLALINLTGESDDLFPLNLHPTKYYHRAIARALASRQEIADTVGTSDLYDPGAIPPSPCAWRLQAGPNHGGWATVERPDDPMSPFRVTQIHPGSARPWEISLRRDRLAVRAGQRYTVSLRLRADAPRPLHVNMSQNHPPWTILGFGADLELSTDWRDYEFSFVCPADEPNASLVFFLAASPVPFEARRVTLSDGQSDLITGRPLEAPAPGGPAAQPN